MRKRRSKEVEKERKKSSHHLVSQFSLFSPSASFSPYFVSRLKHNTTAENRTPPRSSATTTMAAPTASQQQLRAAFSRRGFQLPADDAGSPVGAKLAALMATDGAAAASGSTKAADGLARQFEAYAMAT